MLKFNQTEKLAYQMRKNMAKGSVNNETSKATKTYSVMYLGQQSLYSSEYYHFCQAEINRLVASGNNRKHYSIK